MEACERRDGVCNKNLAHVQNLHLLLRSTHTHCRSGCQSRAIAQTRGEEGKKITPGAHWRIKIELPAVGAGPHGKQGEHADKLRQFGAPRLQIENNKKA